MKMKKAVFAGGTHSGKTSLVEYFRNEGHETLSESGIAVINLLVGSMGWEGYRAWRADNPDEFIARIVDYQIRSERAIRDSAGVVFLDRGVLDYAAMAAHMGAATPRALIEHMKQDPYDCIFICDTLSKDDERAGEGRLFTTEDSLKIGEHAERLYREYGYDPVLLPDVPLKERVQKVKEVLKLP